jgi:DNA-binding response OmpR family regulator
MQDDMNTDDDNAQRDARDVLVVDDDPAIVRMMRLMLRSNGFRVSEAHNGAEALVEFEHHRPRAIVLDVEMPVMDGRAFYRRLRQRDADVPVLILSAGNARAVQRELGAQGYIGKPFGPDDLVEAVTSIL